MTILHHLLQERSKTGLIADFYLSPQLRSVGVVTEKVSLQKFFT